MTCPACGGTLTKTLVLLEHEVHPAYQVRGETLPLRRRLTSALTCDACEFCVEHTGGQR